MAKAGGDRDAWSDLGVPVVPDGCPADAVTSAGVNVAGIDVGKAVLIRKRPRAPCGAGHDVLSLRHIHEPEWGIEPWPPTYQAGAPPLSYTGTSTALLRSPWGT